MKHWIVMYLPWFLSGLAIAMTQLAGNMNRHTWAVGLVAQVGWSVWIVASETWGLIPLNVCLWYVYTRNHLKWNRRP